MNRIGVTESDKWVKSVWDGVVGSWGHDIRRVDVILPPDGRGSLVSVRETPKDDRKTRGDTL